MHLILVEDNVLLHGIEVGISDYKKKLHISCVMHTGHSHDICIRVMKKNTTFSINLECPFVLLMTNKIIVQSYENQRRFM